MVDPQKVIVPVSTFFNMFEDLQRQAGESGIKFTCMSPYFKDMYTKSKNISQLCLSRFQI